MNFQGLSHTIFLLGLSTCILVLTIGCGNKEEGGKSDISDIKKREVNSVIPDNKSKEAELPQDSNSNELANPINRNLSDKDFVYTGLANGMENLVANVDRISEKFGMDAPEYPYREYLEEIYSLLESRDYGREKLYSYYEDYLKKVNRDWFKNSKKVKQIMTLAEETEPSLFIQEVEKLFEDKKNIALMLLRVEAYHAQGRIKDLFAEIKGIIIALDDFNSEHMDKRALLYSLLQSASFFGYMLDDIDNITDGLQRPKRVSISHPEFLAALELDGKL